MNIKRKQNDNELGKTLMGIGDQNSGPAQFKYCQKCRSQKLQTMTKHQTQNFEALETYSRQANKNFNDKTSNIRFLNTRFMTLTRHGSMLQRNTIIQKQTKYGHVKMCAGKA